MRPEFQANPIRILAGFGETQSSAPAAAQPLDAPQEIKMVALPCHGSTSMSSYLSEKSSLGIDVRSLFLPLGIVCAAATDPASRPHLAGRRCTSVTAHLINRWSHGLCTLATLACMDVADVHMR